MDYIKTICGLEGNIYLLRKSRSNQSYHNPLFADNALIKIDQGWRI